jgi:hypothetical protein
VLHQVYLQVVIRIFSNFMVGINPVMPQVEGLAQQLAVLYGQVLMMNTVFTMRLEIMVTLDIE